MAYYQFKDTFSQHNGLLLKDERLVIPTCLRLDMLDLLHQGHLGIQKCRDRATRALWWPGLSKQIDELVKNCPVCARHKPAQAEPLQTTPLPDRPWQRIAADLCEIRGMPYLVVVDYYSRYIEMARLNNDTKSTTIINHLKSIFARHGIPEVMVTDNGPQFVSSEMNNFGAEYGFTHITSSPKYAQSNGAAENAVKRVKSAVLKSKDPYLALLTYRSTPLVNEYSPAELLMGRRLRTTLPVAPHTLKPKQTPEIIEKEMKYRENMEANYNRRHRARDLPILKPEDKVYIRDRNCEGTVIKPAINSPRSYVVKTPTHTIRRNRQFLNKLPLQLEPKSPTIANSPPVSKPDQNSIITRSGRVSKPPDRLHTKEIQPQ